MRLRSQDKPYRKSTFSNAHSIVFARPGSLLSRTSVSKLLPSTHYKTLKPIESPPKSPIKEKPETAREVRFQIEIPPKLIAIPDSRVIEATPKGHEFFRLIKAMNSNMCEIKNDISKIETKYAKRDTEKSFCSRVNLSPQKTQNAEMTAVKNSNRKMQIKEEQIASDYQRAIDQRSYLKSENELYKQKYDNLKYHGDKCDNYLDKLVQDKQELELRILDCQSSIHTIEEEHIASREVLRAKKDELNIVKEKFKFESEEREKFKAALKAEMDDNGGLEIENQKLRLEIKNFKMIADDLKDHLEHMKMSSREALDFLKLTS